MTSEHSMGIINYLSEIPGFYGVIKQRYSDFIVNEIDEYGNIVQLNSRSLPEKEKDQDPECDASVLDKDTRLQLDALVNSSVDSSVVIEASDDKEHRRKIHDACRVLYPKLSSYTKEEEGKRFIVVTRKSNDKQNRTWPRGRPNYLSFVLYKENINTLSALNSLASCIHVGVKMFAAAGNKDKQAKTSQLITAYRVTAEKIANALKNSHMIHTGNFKYVKSPLKLGQLSGNHFKIVLRNVRETDDKINKCLSTVSENGFINYFGMQRFGTTSISTHTIGRSLLRGSWKEVIDLILKPHSGDKYEPFREVWDRTRDASAALAACGRYRGVEHMLLSGLVRFGDKDLVSAFSRIPWSMRQLYLHSYQSYIWNTMVSRRISYSRHPIPGDLIIKRNKSLNHKSYNDKDKTPEILQADDVNSVSMYDIVLPLPGHNIMYPENDVRKWYEELLTADGLDLQVTPTHKAYSLRGTYRHILCKVEDLHWSIVNYEDKTLPLVLGDWEIWNNETVQTPDVPESENRAVVMNFSLPTSSYATMMLREVLRTDSLSSHHFAVETCEDGIS